MEILQNEDNGVVCRKNWQDPALFEAPEEAGLIHVMWLYLKVGTGSADGDIKPKASEVRQKWQLWTIVTSKTNLYGGFPLLLNSTTR